MTSINVGAFTKIGCGMYVVCARKGERFNGQIANTVFQLTSQPATIAVSINKTNLTGEYIRESHAFTVSILERDTPLAFIGRWGFRSGRDIDKFEGTRYRIGETKAPVVLDHTLAYLEAKVIQEVDVGTHALFVGQVVACDVIGEGEPLTYSYYHQVKRGTTPKTAPSYIEPAKGA